MLKMTICKVNIDRLRKFKIIEKDQQQQYVDDLTDDEFSEFLIKQLIKTFGYDRTMNIFKKISNNDHSSH